MFLRKIWICAPPNAENHLSSVTATIRGQFRPFANWCAARHDSAVKEGGQWVAGSLSPNASEIPCGLCKQRYLWMTYVICVIEDLKQMHPRLSQSANAALVWASLQLGGLALCPSGALQFPEIWLEDSISETTKVSCMENDLLEFSELAV